MATVTEDGYGQVELNPWLALLTVTRGGRQCPRNSSPKRSAINSYLAYTDSDQRKKRALSKYRKEGSLLRPTQPCSSWRDTNSDTLERRTILGRLMQVTSLAYTIRHDLKKASLPPVPKKIELRWLHQVPRWLCNLVFVIGWAYLSLCMCLLTLSGWDSP